MREKDGKVLLDEGAVAEPVFDDAGLQKAIWTCLKSSVASPQILTLCCLCEQAFLIGDDIDGELLLNEEADGQPVYDEDGNVIEYVAAGGYDAGYEDGEEDPVVEGLAPPALYFSWCLWA